MNRSHAVTAKLIVPISGSIDGVVIDETDVQGGWTLYVRNGKPAYVYRFIGVESYKVTAADPLPAGEHEVRLEVAYNDHDAGGIVTLFVDGAKAASTRVRRTHAAPAFAHA